MKKVLFELEVVTPLFLGDADGKPELRPPSIRGAMRFWFRAMMGGVLCSKYSGEELIKELYKKEADIWGTTEASGKVIVKISNNFNSRDGKNFSFNKRGLRYLGYGLNDRKYIPEGTRFNVELVFRNASEHEKKLIVESFRLLIYIGNLGSRSRRGFGGLKIIQDKTEGDTIFKNCSSVKELKIYIPSSLESILEHFKDFVGVTYSEPKGEPPFSVISPDFWTFKIINHAKPSSVEALNWIGERLRDFREDKTRGEHRGTSKSGRTYPVSAH